MINLKDIFNLLDSECRIELINYDTKTSIITGLCGIVDYDCPELDWEVVHILTGHTTKIWIKHPNHSEEEF